MRDPIEHLETFVAHARDSISYGALGALGKVKALALFGRAALKILDDDTKTPGLKIRELCQEAACLDGISYHESNSIGGAETWLEADTASWPEEHYHE